MSSTGSSDVSNGKSFHPMAKESNFIHEEVYSELRPESRYLNRWSRYRAFIREPFAEFLGVAILVIFGNGVNCQVALSANPNVAPSPKGEYLSTNFGWAIGTALGVLVSESISGGHINPAVTLALATFRGFPWKKVPIYIFAQLLGGIVGAAVAYANYIHAIDIVEGGRDVRTFTTASLFSTYALDYLTDVSAFFDQFLGAVILVIVVFILNDKKKGPPPVGLTPVILCIAIMGIGVSLGMQTGYSINPARDLGARILTAMVGYGKEVFTFRNQYWIWCPVMGPILGGLFGAFLYDAFLYTGEESIFNRPDDQFRQHSVQTFGSKQTQG